MSVRIPVVRREFARRVNPAAPQMAAVGMGGFFDAANSLLETSRRIGNEAAQRDAMVDKQEDEQRRARNLDRLSQTRLAWTEALIKRQTEAAEGAPDFTPSLLKDFDAHRDKALAEVKDERERTMLQGMLAPVREHLHEKGIVFESSARAKYRSRVLGEGVEQDAKTAALDPAQFRDLLAARLATISATQDLPAETKAALAELARERIGIQAALTLIDRPGGPEDWLARTGVAGGKAKKDGKTVQAPALAPGMADPIIASLSDAALRQTIERATTMKVQRDSLAAADVERRQRMAEAASERRERKAERAFGIADSLIRDGLPLDPTNPDNQKLISDMSGTRFEAAIRAKLEELPKRTAAALQPIDVQRQQLDELRTQAATKGTSKATKEEIERREQVLRGAETAFQKDPLRALGERFPQARVAPLDTSTPESLEASLVARAPAVEAAQRFARGTPVRVSPLLDDEAPAIKAKIDSLPEAERSTYIARLARAAGPHGAVAMAEQLGKGGDRQARVLELQFKAGAAATMAGRYRGEFIARGARALDDKTVLKDSAAVSGWEAQIAARVDKLRLPNAADTKDIKDAAGYVVAALAAEKSGVAGRREIERAVQIVVGGTIVEQGGGNIVLPDGVTHSQLTQTLRATTPKTLLTARRTSAGTEIVPFNAAEEQVRVDGAQIPVQAFLQSLPGARLTTLRPGLYGVLVGPGEGRFVTTMDGAPIVIAGPR